MLVYVDLELTRHSVQPAGNMNAGQALVIDKTAPVGGPRNYSAPNF